MLLVAHNLAVMQLDDAFAHRVDDFLVMRGHHDGRAGAVDCIKDFHDAERCRRIQVAGRLVGKQDLRMVHIRTRDSHALLLAAGQLMRIVLLLAGKPDRLKHLGHQRPDG